MPQLFGTDSVLVMDARKWTTLSAMVEDLAAVFVLDSLDGGVATDITNAAEVEQHPFWEALEVAVEDADSNFVAIAHADAPSADGTRADSVVRSPPTVLAHAAVI